ncbi:L,D-transpeptidase family protein [Novosphingobium piscinae]|uniref:L,D-transpeptidase family protein n=1 Tax=Novosphingobium piscinae TaxID=1507448 RepID=UPI001C8CD762|nr:L,D-transpeptidase family protein [Novosphingobium piscinae]
MASGAWSDSVSLPQASDIRGLPAAPEPAVPAPVARGAGGAGPVSPTRPTVAEALDSGVLIVISKASQRMDAFRQGEPWLTAPVSTGRSGHRTPAGVFPILEKRRFHRSNLYSNAPMPFMQRLTMGGIAIHAGRLPGYPASHGCIRVSAAVARTLFDVTSSRDTVVVIVNEPVTSADQARQLALAWPRAPAPLVQPRLLVAPGMAQVVLPAPGRARRLVAASRGAAPQAWPATSQTIQLAAALTPQEAEAYWTRLLGRHPDLARFSKVVVPVEIGARRFFRLRASGTGAHASCSQLKTAGTDCFKVI